MLEAFILGMVQASSSHLHHRREDRKSGAPVIASMHNLLGFNVIRHVALAVDAALPIAGPGEVLRAARDQRDRERLPKHRQRALLAEAMHQRDHPSPVGFPQDLPERPTGAGEIFIGDTKDALRKCQLVITRGADALVQEGDSRTVQRSPKFQGILGRFPFLQCHKALINACHKINLYYDGL